MRKVKKVFKVFGIIIILVIMGILVWKYRSNKIRNNISSFIGPSDVWNPSDTAIGKWQECKNLDCVSDVMGQYGASLGARNFTKLLSQPPPQTGYLNEFQEMGKIDLGKVDFPDRANTNEAYYLLNGLPLFVSTEISRGDVDVLMNEVEQTPLYVEAKKKYPNIDIDIWPVSSEFIEKKILPNKDEEFIFMYGLGCHACHTEYSANVGFDFDSNGKFLKIVFLQIVKENSVN